MRALLHVASGALAGRRVALRTGKPLRVGRSDRADVVLSHDEQMAAVHFELTWKDGTCQVRDVSKRGTWLDGQTVSEGAVRNGGVLRAGDTTFLLRVVPADLRAGLPPPPERWRPPSPELVAQRARVLESLMAEAQKAPLFAILDAARDRRIKTLVDACEDENRSLFDGAKGDLLADGAPYLVRFEAGSELLEVVVGEGWGDAWGTFLTSRRPLAEVRQRLRRSLLVLDEETQQKLFFRFYDPRVLRLFWPTCSPRQKSEMLGTEIGAFLLEGDSGEMLRLGVEDAC